MKIADIITHRIRLSAEAIWPAMRSKQQHLYNLREAIWGNLDVALWNIKGKAAGMSIANAQSLTRIIFSDRNTKSWNWSWIFLSFFSILYNYVVRIYITTRILS
jgi:hypothetical protein